MIKKIVKPGSNIQHNFNISSDIAYWAIKYNTSIDEIQKIFTESGNSVSKTIEILRAREQSA